MSPAVRSVLLGLLYNLLVVVGFAIIYGLVLVNLVARFHWARFLGEAWFFALVALLLPAYFFFSSRKPMALGALLGLVTYFLVVIPLVFIGGD